MIKEVCLALSALCLVAVPLMSHADEATDCRSSWPFASRTRKHAGQFSSLSGIALGFEFDVEKTKDGHLVCIHDGTVDRTTNGTGKIAELTLEEIRRLDAGSWFDPKFAGKKCRPSMKF